MSCVSLLAVNWTVPLLHTSLGGWVVVVVGAWVVVTAVKKRLLTIVHGDCLLAK